VPNVLTTDSPSGAFGSPALYLALWKLASAYVGAISMTVALSLEYLSERPFCDLLPAMQQKQGWLLTIKEMSLL
jgi:hypothetical protein